MELGSGNAQEAKRVYNPGRFRSQKGNPGGRYHGKSYALNRGVREARGDVVVFTDDDVTMEATWLQSLTASLHNAEWAGAGGRTLPERDFGPPHWLALDRRHAAPLGIFDMGSEAKEMKESPFGNNMALRKKVVEKHGGFRTDLGPCAGSSYPQKSEDSEFGIRLLAAGERLRYEPSAVVYHCVPRSRIQKEYFLLHMRKLNVAFVVMLLGLMAVAQGKHKPVQIGTLTLGGSNQFGTIFVADFTSFAKVIPETKGGLWSRNRLTIRAISVTASLPQVNL